MDRAVFHPVPPYRPHVAAACSSCRLREICLTGGLSAEELQYVEQHLVAVQRLVARGDRLFAAGDPFEAVYAVRTGFFKTYVVADRRHQQVTGFQMSGDLLGFDGVGARQYMGHAVALEDSQVCVIAYTELEALARMTGSLQHQIHRVMSREIVRNQGVILLLGSMHAEQRLAVFLLNLAHRLQARGYSPSSFVLRMSREEIGSYLGMKVETVSRTFTKLQANGLVFVRNRQVMITDPVGLQLLLDGEAA